MSELLDRLSPSQKSPEKLMLLAEAAHILNSTIEYEDLMKNVLTLVTHAVNAEASIVYRYDPSHKDLRARFYSTNEEPRQITFPVGQGFVGWVAEHREPIVTNDPTHDPRFSPHIHDVELKSIICCPLNLRGSFFGVIEAINKKDSQFDQSDLETLQLLSDQIAVAIRNAQLYRTVKKQALQRQTLFEVSRQLMSPLTLDAVLHDILLALKKVLDFDAGGVYLINEVSGEVESISSIGYEKVLEADLRMKIGQGVVGWVARTGEPQIVPDTSKDDRYINARPQTKSEMVAPIRSGSTLIGVLNLESDKSDAFTEEGKEILLTFAPQAAISIERAKLHKALLEQKKIEEQLTIARAIQTSFLPESVPVVDGYELWGTNIPSGEVGGDYYDFIKIVENQLGIAVADVSGKGIPASLIMAAFRASLIAEIRNNYAIRTICQKVNNLLYESVKPGNFVTAIYGVLDSENSIFTFSNCGHNPGILLHDDDNVEELLEGGMALGIRNQSEYKELSIDINSGDILCLYTDGVTEAADPDGEQFDTVRVIKILKRYRHLPAAEIGTKIIDAVKTFAWRGESLDDLTLIVIKRL